MSDVNIFNNIDLIVSCFRFSGVLVEDSSLSSNLRSDQRQVPVPGGVGHCVPCHRGHVLPLPLTQPLLSPGLHHPVPLRSQACQVQQRQVTVSKINHPKNLLSGLSLQPFLLLYNNSSQKRSTKYFTVSPNIF